jgi:hypothetical protein
LSSNPGPCIYNAIALSIGYAHEDRKLKTYPLEKMKQTGGKVMI